MTALSKWRSNMKNKLAAIINECSKPNWDSYGATPIDKNCIQRAKLIIGKANPTNVVPLPSGGLQLEWGSEIELEIHPTSFECNVTILAEGVDEVLRQVRRALQYPTQDTDEDQTQDAVEDSALREEIDRLKAQLVLYSSLLLKAIDEVNAWKDASGLECGGDPDCVTPEKAAEYWRGIDNEVRRLRGLLDLVAGGSPL